MALVGKYTKYDVIDTGETEIQTIEYPNNLPDGHPDFNKAGTKEEVERPVYENISTDYQDAYVTVQAVQIFKHKAEDDSKNLFNITYRVYENKDDKINDLNSYIKQDFIVAQEIDYLSGKNETTQAYELVKMAQGCEELVND